MNDLVFHSHPLLWLALVVAAVLVLWTTFTGMQSRKRSVTLMLLRFAALVCLGLMLLQPQRRSEQVTALRPQLALLVDNSQSMAEKVDPNQPTRSEAALRFLQSPTLKAQDWDLRIFSFDKEAKEISSPAALDFKGTDTQIAGAIARVRDYFRTQPLAAILLLSDGLERGEQRTPKPDGVPVLTFELEKPFKPKQVTKRISVANIDYPQCVVVGWDAEIRMAVTAKGMSGETITVELWREGIKAAESPVSFSQDEQTRQLGFPISHNVAGSAHYELRIGDTAADRSARSNAFVIEAMEPGNRVLYIQNALGFDFKFLRKAIMSERNLQLHAFVRWADGRLLRMAEAGEQELDLSARGLRDTAVVILGDLNPEALAPDQCKALRDFVDRGGGLVLMGGPNSLASPLLAKSALAPMLPATVPAPYKEGDFPMAITKAGLYHPVFGSLFKSIEDFPPLLTANIAPGLAANAEVLVQTPTGAPIVATMRYGQGRAVMIMSDTLWRWRLASQSWSAARSPYDTFWAQLMDWLIPKEQEKQENNTLDLFSERSEYVLGTQPELRAVIRAENPPPTISLKLQTPDDRNFEYTMRQGSFVGRDGKAVNGYRVTVEPNQPGVFQAKAVATANGKVLSGETRFLVGAPANELTAKAIDRSFLGKIAVENAGHYYGADQWEQWRKDLRIKETYITRTELTDLWNHPVLLGLLLLMLFAEWTVRKLWNLP